MYAKPNLAAVYPRIPLYMAGSPIWMMSAHKWQSDPPSQRSSVAWIGKRRRSPKIAVPCSHPWISLALVLILLFSSACQPAAEEPPSPPKIELEAIFREFYEHYGGEATCGKPIKPARREGDLLIQLLERCELIYDEKASDAQYFRFGKLGLRLGLEEPPVSPPANPDLVYVDGHIIFPAFLPMYQRFGQRLTGRPITEVRYNLIERRYEQFFESVGFFVMEGSNQVGLLALGLWLCGQECINQETASLEGILEVSNQIEPTFHPFIERMGADFTGFALAPSFVNEEGLWVQILENVVLAADAPGKPDTVRLLPLARILHVPEDPAKPYSGDSNMFFYPTQGDLGYEIPLYFLEYINLHGGFAVAGQPISSYKLLKENLYHQCFINLCLTYDLTLYPSSRIRAEPLGRIYKLLYYEEPPAPPTQEATPTPFGFEQVPPLPQREEIILQVWEQYPMLPFDQLQMIWVKVMHGDFPAPDMQPELILLLPNKSRLVYTMQPTGEDGKTSALLPPIEAQNGEVIDYKVCLPITEEARFCVQDSFIIWNNP